MTSSRTTITIISLAVLVSLMLASSCFAKDAAQAAVSPQSSSLASKLLPPTKSRTARSLGDMFEKVRSKIFGSRKQQANTANQQVQPASSVNVAQRQPWADINSYNQQYGPLSSYSSSYQWPSSNNQYLGQQYNPMNGYISSQAGSSSYPGLSGLSQSSPIGASNVLSSGLEGQQQSAQGSLNPAANSNSGNGASGGLLSSASQLIAQYLSPSSSSNSQSGIGAQSNQGQNSQQSNGQQSGQNLLNAQQQAQSPYNEFASILDSMVAQTGVSSQRQPSLNQYLSSGPTGQSQQQQMQAHGLQSGQQQSIQGYQPANLMGAGQMVPDQDMSGSSSIQSYLPAATAQQASQKSSMVGLAEQLAPGSQFNKLVSFPFSLSSNDDPSKEGRYKLHIPFLNNHVKRSDQQQQVSNANQPQLQQRQHQQAQLLNQYYNQQYAAAAQQQNQLMAQASQVVPTIISPQSPSSQSAPIGGSSLPSNGISNAAPSSQQSVSVASSASSSASAPSVPSSASASSSLQSAAAPQSSSSMLSSPNSPSASSSVVGGQSGNSRPAWSVADLQSSSSSAKLIPMPSAASSSVDSIASSQS